MSQVYVRLVFHSSFLQQCYHAKKRTLNFCFRTMYTNSNGLLVMGCALWFVRHGLRVTRNEHCIAFQTNL